MSTTSPETEPAAGSKTLYCSFCGKSQKEVNKLIAGPTVFICNECIELCVDILDESPERIAEKQRARARENAIDDMVNIMRELLATANPLDRLAHHLGMYDTLMKPLPEQKPVGSLAFIVSPPFSSNDKPTT